MLPGSLIGDCTCGHRSPRCDRCLQACLDHSRGIARGIGVEWAKRVAYMAPEHPRRPWPAYEGRAAARARELVGYLEDDERLVDGLARECWSEARWWWEDRDPPDWPVPWWVRAGR